MLVIVMLPGTVPAVVGVKVTDTGTDCPALIVFGVATPLIPNSAPLKVITETVKSDEPLFPMEKVDVPFDPIVTLPKSSTEGVREICCCGEVVIVPLRLTTPEVVPEPAP